MITVKLLNRNEAASWLPRCLAFALLLLVRSVFADSYWQGGTSGFNVAGSWNPAGVPTSVNAINDSGSNNVVLIRPGDPVWRPWDIRAGDGVNTSGSFLQTGSTNVVNGWFRLGDSANSTGYYTLSNGAVNVLLQAHVGEAGVGVLTISGGTFAVGQNPFCFGDGDFGAGGMGTLIMNGGTLNMAVGVDLWLGEGHNNGPGGTGKMIMNGGTVNIGGWFAIGRFGGIGDLELLGGNITMSPGNTGNITLATTPSTGVVNQSGGALTNTVSQTWVAESASGTWNLNGGTDVLGVVLLTRLSGASGTFNLNSGDLFATQILDPGGNGTFNFNGGTLHARANSGNFLEATHGIPVKTGGAFINSEGHDVTISQPLANGGGGLIKLGAGSLTLSGGLSYSGATIVSNGTLIISAPNTVVSSSCAVSTGAMFGVILTSANAQISVPILTLAAGSGLNLNFAGVGGQPLAPLHVNSLALNGPVTLNIAGFNFSPGQIPLVQYGSRTGNGDFTLGSLPSGMVAQLVTNAANNSIDLVVTSAATGGMPWQPKQAPLMTEWAQQVNPTDVLPEYPRPQMVRSNWMNLNGVWQFQSGATNDPVPSGQNLAGVILVPFPMESALSGVMQYSPFSWYRRQFAVPDDWSGQRILLHFDAVNWRSQIYVNGQSVGIHTGGYDPFSYDITPFLTNSGTQELIVRVYSPVDSGGEPRGKQTLYPAGIMFTSSSGIWQPVWLEPVPITSSINSIHLTPDIDNNRLLVNVSISGATNGLRVNGFAFAGTNQVASTTVFPGNNLFLNIPSPTLWSPTNPYLYDLQITLTTNSTTVDSVGSYFGMRKISLGTQNGFKKIFLNNQFMFEFGPLDQGYWPDGVYTAPTDLALQSDLRMEKALGFNMVRKHIKVEPQRWYYWADKLGMLVWQDMPSCNSYTGNPSPPRVDPLDFIAELTAMVTNHWNSPGIIMWVAFNEGQGQQGSANGVGQTNTAYLVSLIKSLDPSRLVNQASGWNYAGVGDVLDAHNYPDPQCPTSASQAVACGEFGGVWLGVTGHTWSPSSSDVSAAQASTSVASQFEGLANELPNLIQNQGMSAAVYTEISDVEIELAGLVTFDRKLLKPNLHRMQVAITSLTGIPISTNTPPVLSPVGSVTITAGQTLFVTNSATDSDSPAQTLTWSLATQPAGVSINAANGLITWRPAISQSPSTNFFRAIVTDNGIPPLSATQSFSVVVLRPATPVFSSPAIFSGTFRATVSGSVGPDYSVYAATNLSSGWQLLLRTNPVALPFEFTDPNAANFQQRYYRVLLGP